MEKKEIVTKLNDLKDKAEDMRGFKGKAEIVRQMQSSLDFIRSHKVDLSLMEKLLKEREKDFEIGLKFEEKKYAEKEASRKI